MLGIVLNCSSALPPYSMRQDLSVQLTHPDISYNLLWGFPVSVFWCWNYSGPAHLSSIYMSSGESQFWSSCLYGHLPRARGFFYAISPQINISMDTATYGESWKIQGLSNFLSGILTKYLCALWKQVSVSASKHSAASYTRWRRAWQGWSTWILSNMK